MLILRVGGPTFLMCLKPMTSFPIQLPEDLERLNRLMRRVGGKNVSWGAQSALDVFVAEHRIRAEARFETSNSRHLGPGGGHHRARCCHDRTYRRHDQQWLNPWSAERQVGGLIWNREPVEQATR